PKSPPRPVPPATRSSRSTKCPEAPFLPDSILYGRHPERLRRISVISHVELQRSFAVAQDDGKKKKAVGSQSCCALRYSSVGGFNCSTTFASVIKPPPTSSVHVAVSLG